MIKNNLPLSPHLQIYKPQITSILSIAHRISGFCLSLSLIFFAVWLFSLSQGEMIYNLFLKIIKTIPARIISFMAILGFFYHMFNGIRHIIWDFGYGLEISTSAKLGYLVLFLSLLSTICFSLRIGIL